MPTVTRYTSTGPRWGDSGYNSNTTYLYVGKSGTSTYYGRFGFLPINKTWYIKSIKLRMKRIDDYSSKVLKVGSRADDSWANKTSTAFTQEIAVSSGQNTKEWDLTAYKGILQGYTGEWFLHVRHGSGDNSYCEFAGGTGSSSPRLVIEYEEATLSVPGGEFTIGAASAITVGTAGSGLMHKVSSSIGASSGALNGGAAVNAGDLINWMPPAALANEITVGMVGTVRLTLESYLDGVLSSTILLDYPLKVPASFLPVINSGSTTFSLLNPVGDTVGVYVQGRSKTVCAINVTPCYGSPVVEYKLTISGKTYTVPAGEMPVNPFTITTDALTATGALTAVIEVTDARGQKATLVRSSAVTVNAYFAPMVTGLSLTRALSDQTPSNEGTYIKFTLTCVFAAIANLNTKAGSIRFKASGSSWSTSVSLNSAMAAAGATVYSFTITGVIGSGAIGSGSYAVSVTLADRYTTVPEVFAELPSKKIYFDLHSSGEGVAIGKVADVASLFDVGLDSRFDGVVSLGESGQYGNKNELPNPTAQADAAGWTLATNVTRDTTYTLMGCNSFKSTQSGNAADVYRGGKSDAFPCTPGSVFSHSMYFWIDDYLTFQGGQLWVNTQFLDVGGAILQYNTARIAPTQAHNGKWTRLAANGAVAPAGTVSVDFRFYVQRNGTAWFACPKLEKGPLATEFVANVVGDVNFKGAVGFADPAAVLAALGVQKGTVNFNLSASTGSNFIVTFPRAYAAAPQVMITMESTSSSWTPGAVTAITYGITTTGLTIRVMNGYSASRGGTIHWRAEGVLA